MTLLLEKEGGVDSLGVGGRPSPPPSFAPPNCPPYPIVPPSPTAPTRVRRLLGSEETVCLQRSREIFLQNIKRPESVEGAHLRAGVGGGGSRGGTLPRLVAGGARRKRRGARV